MASECFSVDLLELSYTIRMAIFSVILSDTENRQQSFMPVYIASVLMRKSRNKAKCCLGRTYSDKL